VSLSKLCPKLILEGTRLTGKTELAFALNEHPRLVGQRRYRYHSPLVSGEWCGFTNFPWGRGLINFDSDTEEELAMETFGLTENDVVELARMSCQGTFLAAGCHCVYPHPG